MDSEDTVLTALDLVLIVGGFLLSVLCFVVARWLEHREKKPPTGGA